MPKWSFLKLQRNKGIFFFLACLLGHSSWLTTSFCFSLISNHAPYCFHPFSSSPFALINPSATVYLEGFLNSSLTQLINALHKWSRQAPGLSPLRFPPTEVSNFLKQTTRMIVVLAELFSPCETAVLTFREILQLLFHIICCFGKFYSYNF